MNGNGEVTVTQHNEQLVLEKAALASNLDTMRRGLILLAAHAADDKDKIRIPKQSIAADVVDVQWKLLKSGSVIFTVIRQPTEEPP